MNAALLTQLLALYGYVAVAVFVGLESLGIPLPGESILIAAALYAGSTHRLNVVAAAAVSGTAAAHAARGGTGVRPKGAVTGS